MNQNQLKYFVAAAETRSFSKAAEEFFISQAAITQQIKFLESELEVQLFDRSTRPVTLTAAGRTFFVEAKAILERMSRSRNLVRDTAAGMSGTLRIGYLRGYERSSLSSGVQKFHYRNPNVLVTFYRCSSDILASGILQGDYDIIFTWDSTNLKQNVNIAYKLIERARLVVALYSRHPLAQRHAIDRKELSGESIIFMSPSETDDSYGDAYFMNLYYEAGFKPNILARTADTESVLMMVAAEEGTSILPDYCTTKLYHAENLAFVPLKGEWEKEEIIAVWKKENRNPALRRFVETLGQEMSGDIAEKIID